MVSTIFLSLHKEVDFSEELNSWKALKSLLYLSSTKHLPSHGQLSWSPGDATKHLILHGQL